MKQEDAIRHLRELLYVVQKIRSIHDEEGLFPKDGDLHKSLWKWVWGDHCIVGPLAELLDWVDETGHLSPHDYYNFIYIATHLEPMLYAATRDPSFPHEARIEWLRGWET